MMSGRDSLGCSSQHLQTSRELLGANVAIYHKVHSDTQLNQVIMPATDRGILAGISLGGGHRRKIFQGHRAATYDFAEGGVYVRNLAEDYKADLHPFEFLLVEIPIASLQDSARGLGLDRSFDLSCVPGHRDPVLHHLALALLPVLDRPGEVDPLFVDQVAASFETYLISRYAGGTPHRLDARRSMSRSQEILAKELLRENLGGELLISAIAAECGLSRGHFTRAFREATGMTPHRWLTTQRIVRAKSLLADRSLSLADVAIACGFSDQSHLTRVFAKATGATPAAWRREAT